MAIYLREFATQAAYEAAQSSLMLPNVSLIDETNGVEYNPSSPEPPSDPRLIAVYNVTSTSSPTQIINEYAESQFSAIEIDDVEQPSVVSAYTFDTVGEHTVKYTLTDPTIIGNSAFYDCGRLASIVIPNSVTSIDADAFLNCSNLTSCTIGSSVTSIGNEAFSACTSLASIDIPSNVTSIGYNAFGYCTSLTSLTVDNNNTVYDSRDNCNAIIETNTNTLIKGCESTLIPNSVTSIGNEAFSSCSGLTSIVIPSSVTSIGGAAFDSCSNLASIVIPSSVTSIGMMAFNYCEGLTSCTIGSGVTSIGDYAFQNCTSLTSIVIPDSVTSIGYWVFAYCNSLTSVTIGSGVTSISGSAFYDCSSLTSIVSNAMTAPTIQNNTFQNVKTGGTLTVPQGSSGYNVWMSTGNYYLGKYNWTKVEQ